MSDLLSPEDQGVTPTLEEVIRAGVREALLNVNVSMPGIVETFDSTKNTISVRPALKRQYESDGAIVALPIINKVPVVFPRGGNFKMKWNLKKGDTVQLVFAQRSIDVWKSSGGVVDPDDPRRFHLSDAVAHAGGYDLTNPIANDVSDRTVLVSGSSEIHILDSGKFKLKNAGQELFDLLDQTLTKLISLTDKLSTDTTNTQIGPQKLNFFSDYATLKTDLTTIKTNLDTLKG